MQSVILSLLLENMYLPCTKNLPEGYKGYCKQEVRTHTVYIQFVNDKKKK